MKWYLEVLKKYAQFSGRSRRKEFWWFWGFDTAISPLLALVDLVLFGDVLVRFHGLGPIAALYWVALVIPGRRWRPGVFTIPGVVAGGG